MDDDEQQPVGETKIKQNVTVPSASNQSIGNQTTGNESSDVN